MNTLTQDQTQLAFIEDFSQKQYELFEVDPLLLEEILNGTQSLKIKSYQQQDNKTQQLQRTAALCSNDATFKLKKSETSNTMFVVGMQSGQILKQTSITIDLERSQTNTYQVAKLILQYPLFNENEMDDSSSSYKTISRQQILHECQISEGEFDLIVNSEEKYDLYIIEIAKNQYSFFDPMQLYTLIDSILIFISQQQDQDLIINAEQILLNHDGIINEKFTGDCKMIEYALNYIADKIEGTNDYKLRNQKITKSITLAMLYVKGDYYLGEFINALKNALEMGLPQSLMNENLDSKQKFEPAQNLFEYYDSYDLSYLKSYAIIIPAQELRIVQKQDDVIRLLHPYYSAEFDNCNNSGERRLDALFQIKDKWTQQELSQYLKKFIDVGVNFDNYLMKNTKIIREKNPFDQSKDIAYYMKKF